MNPTIKKLPKSVQFLIFAANQINGYTKAVQELVFNSLDANATSIAVRIHIAEGSIQVVDNGYGILQADFKLIGQNHMTSKLADISILKSAPNTYGFQGLSLANLVQVSESLKVTSRFYTCETTHVKSYENGKAKSIVKCSPRPSKGTTIDIKGFLYNLNIQKRSINLINELQSIKTFLEHISLLHTNVSISLRDDSNSEIVFKIHKNRDMYQTLSTLYDIDKTVVQEIQVEKKQYRVKAYIGKRETQETRQLIFLNGKIIVDSSPLHKKVNDNFKKYLLAEKKVNKKNGIDENENLFGKYIPFYFILITCPYMDYELTSNVIEFKDWGQINVLLDKLVKFSNGDNLQLKPAQKNQVTETKRDTEKNRNHVEEIMRQILGNHSKKIDLVQMQTGIKGKLIKRKRHDKKEPRVFTKDVELKLNKQTETRETSTSKSKHATKNIARTCFQKPHINKITKKKKYLATSSNILTPKQVDKQNKQLKNKTSKKLRSKKIISPSNLFAMETDSDKKRCDMLTQESKELVNSKNPPDIFIKENVQYSSNNIRRDNKNITIRKKINEVVIHEYIPLRPKLNVAKFSNNGNPNKQFISNYDLLKTILSTQLESNTPKKSIFALNNMLVDDKKSEHVTKPRNQLSNDDGRNEFASIAPVTDRNHVPLIREQNNITLHNTSLERSFFNFDSRSDSTSIHFQEHMHENNVDRSHFFEKRNAQNNYTPQSKVFDISSQNDTYLHRHNTYLSDMGSRKSRNSVLSTQLPTEDTTIRLMIPYILKETDNDSPFKAITYQSHNYKDQDLSSRSELQCNIFRKTRNFITTQSRENFTSKSIFSGNRIMKNRRFNYLIPKHFCPDNKKMKQNKSTKMFDFEQNAIRGVRGSYTIEEFTEGNTQYASTNNIYRRHKMLYLANTDSTKTQTLSYIFNDGHRESEPLMNPILVISRNNVKEHNHFDYEPINENTFTVKKMSRDMCETFDQSAEKNKIDKTYTVESPETIFFEKEISVDSDSNINIRSESVFVSKSQSQEHSDKIPICNPIDVCEAVLNDYELSMDKIGEFDTSFKQRPDSCPKSSIINIENVNETDERQNEIINNLKDVPIKGCNEQGDQVNPIDYQITQNHNKGESCHHFSKRSNNSSVNSVTIDLTLEDCKKTFNKQKNEVATIENNANEGAFSIRNRLFFVPKGLSPIFKNNETKQNSEHDPVQDYYEDNIYNDFAHRVKNDAEMFKPRVQETNDRTTKDLSKVNNKLNKDNASLKFDGFSIRNAIVLGQVDSKFIAAIMEGKCHKTDHVQRYLVMFDQHAVHERIRLESNLADYLIGSQWKSVSIADVTLKMSRDDIIYLHNYQDKFEQFGLEWTILTYNEISVTAIPAGILGKNLRQVDKIIKAVRNLIKEEINIIQTQSGCVSRYPKSIMDLVFSEACRYAIKFGDNLSRNQCSELLTELSTCKSPFQCAHGRPAMAVIMNLDTQKHDFKINFNMLQKFKKS